MISILKSEDRGVSKFDWLDSRHSFSFGEYFNRDQMAFRVLRVINEDIVAPAQGFGMHPHRDMEIVTYVMSGALEHRDSLGNGSIIQRGRVQKMTAGRGIEHSEFNHSKTEPVHLLQIWILPERKGLQPSYEEKEFPIGSGLTLLASREGTEGAIKLNQDAKIFAGVLGDGEEIDVAFSSGRYAWIQIAKGKLSVQGKPTTAGDGVAISGETLITLKGSGSAEFLVFDLP